MIETTGDLITFALRSSGINGVGQTPLAEDSNTGLDLLRMIMDEWRTKRWLVWNEQELSLVSTGAKFYTIGPGQDFNLPSRPSRIHAAWVRFQPFSGPNAVDLPLGIIESKEDWATLSIKDLVSLPAGVFLDTAWPVGRVYFWPVPPASQYEMHIVTKASLPVYTSLTDPLAVPGEYVPALMWSLCVRLQMSYGLQARPDQVAAMKEAMQTIRMANVQVPTMSMPAGLGGRPTDVSSWVGKGLNRAWVVGAEAVL